MSVPLSRKAEVTKVTRNEVRGFPGGSVGKKLPANAGDAGSIRGSGRPPGEGNGHPLQHSCLGNPVDGGAWRVVAHGVIKESDTTERLNINSKVISNLKIVKVPCYEGYIRNSK